MKILLLPVLALVVVISACSNGPANGSDSGSKKSTGGVCTVDGGSTGGTTCTPEQNCVTAVNSLIEIGNVPSSQRQFLLDSCKLYLQPNCTDNDFKIAITALENNNPNPTGISSSCQSDAQQFMVAYQLALRSAVGQNCITAVNSLIKIGNVPSSQRQFLLDSCKLYLQPNCTDNDFKIAITALENNNPNPTGISSSCQSDAQQFMVAYKLALGSAVGQNCVTAVNSLIEIGNVPSSQRQFLLDSCKLYLQPNCTDNDFKIAITALENNNPNPTGISSSCQSDALQFIVDYQLAKSM